MWRKKTQTFKGHFKYILCVVADDFPMNMWDRLIPQVELTCNLIHQSNVALKVSAQAYTFAPQDFNRMPLAPMGCVVKINQKPSNRRTWGAHSVAIWYLQTSPHHYGCFEVWSKHTGVELISDTVFFKHKHITNPPIYPENAMVQAAKELTEALKGRMPSTLEGSTVKELENLDKNSNQTEMIYKESRDDAPPPQRLRKATTTPQRVTRTHPPCHSLPFEREPLEEKEIVVTSPPLPIMEPHKTVER